MKLRKQSVSSKGECRMLEMPDHGNMQCTLKKMHFFSRVGRTEKSVSTLGSIAGEAKFLKAVRVHESQIPDTDLM